MALDTRRAILTLPIAYVVWFFAFQVPVLNFWLRITIAAFILLATALAVGRKELSLRPTPLGLVVGVVSAVLLYLFFWSGYQVLSGFPQFTGTISSVYSLKGAEPTSFIATVLLFPIGPTEEIYWRGFIQNALSKKLSTRNSITPHVDHLRQHPPPDPKPLAHLRGIHRGAGVGVRLLQVGPGRFDGLARPLGRDDLRLLRDRLAEPASR